MRPASFVLAGCRATVFRSEQRTENCECDQTSIEGVILVRQDRVVEGVVADGLKMTCGR